MSTRLKRLVRAWLPPVVVSAFRKRPRSASEFQGEYASWPSALASADGYGRAEILDKVEHATLRVVRGEAAYERDSVLFDRTQIYWPLLSSLLWAAAREQGRLSVLDFGGSLGSSYRQNKTFLDALPDVHWGVVEQPHFVALGRRRFSDDRLQFFDSIDECAGTIRPNIVVLGSVLQYLEEPFTTLRDLSRTGAGMMVVDRTPFSNLPSDVITVQRVPPPVYDATYPMWIFSDTTFRRRVRDDWTIAETFDCPEGSVNTGTGLTLTFRGMILTR